MDNKVKSAFTVFQPALYVCKRAKSRPVIDGDIDKAFWGDIPFSRSFADIEGYDKPKPKFDTRMKMQWDDEYLYVAAELMGDEIWAHITERDAVIFYDNDFEVFIDPDSDTHCYIELEMNARNTVWDLLLNKPYRDGGFAINHWDFKGLQTAVKIDGVLNDPSARNIRWTVELAIPMASVLEVSHKGERVQEGSYWRINFSRVQWLVDVIDNTYIKRKDPQTGKVLPEENWIWSPQGVVNMHCPELWGFVFFSENGGDYQIPADEVIKWKLRTLYYNAWDYYDAHGVFTRDMGLLTDARNRDCGAVAEITKNSFEIRCANSAKTGEISIFSDGRVVCR